LLVGGLHQFHWVFSGSACHHPLPNVATLFATCVQAIRTRAWSAAGFSLGASYLAKRVTNSRSVHLLQPFEQHSDRPSAAQPAPPLGPCHRVTALRCDREQ